MTTPHQRSRFIALAGLAAAVALALAACAAQPSAPPAQPANFDGLQTPGDGLFVEGAEQPIVLEPATPTPAHEAEAGPPLIGIGEDELARQDSAPFAPVPPPSLEGIETTELLLTPIREHSGIVCANGGVAASVGAVMAGEGVNASGASWMCAGYWAYDLRNLPRQASVTQAFANLGNCYQQDDSFAAHGELQFESLLYDSLDATDYNLSGQPLGRFGACPTHFNATEAVQRAARSGTLLFQMKMYFAEVGLDGGRDYVGYKLEQGSLIIQYY